jgi:serine protease AprX
MKKCFIFLTCALVLFTTAGKAQYSKYIIRLKDKGSSPYTLGNPAAYLSPRALQRRTAFSIAIDSADMPVTPRYIDSIRSSGTVIILNTSKWLNQVAIQTTDAAALAKINSFPFVLGTAPLAPSVKETTDNDFIPINKKKEAPDEPIPTGASGTQNTAADYYNYGVSYNQVHLHNGEFLHNHGFRGEGMQMAVMDAGFLNYLTIPTFDSIRTNNQVLGTWDFVTGSTSVTEDDAHGTYCLSTIAANMPGTFMGTAPKTAFYLYRTEDAFSEYPIEEQNWAAAAERVDSMGVAISSTSLGYTTFDAAQFNHTYADMNGNTTIIARAADMAAKKGMLVIVAAGNDGNNAWRYVGTPADADSALAVGAVSAGGIIGSFSSYGPSSDGQVKPAVAAVGVNAVVASTSNGQPLFGSGTSFACPNMAGLATCLWQAFPEVNNMSIINTLQQAASRFTNPDTRTGYGIPDMKKAFVLLLKKLYTQQRSINECTVSLDFGVKTDASIKLILERKLPAEAAYSPIKTFTGTGNFSLQQLKYTDVLSNTPTGTVQYRTQIVIGTDTTFYADSLSVNYAQQCAANENSITINPNPFSGYLNIALARTTVANAVLVLQNAAGQRIYTTSWQLPVGNTLKTIPVQQLSKGIYFATVYIEGKKAITKKIQKQ